MFHCPYCGLRYPGLGTTCAACGMSTRTGRWQAYALALVVAAIVAVVAWQVMAGSQ